MNNDILKKYGFTASYEGEASFYEGLFPARVVNRNRDLYRVVCRGGEIGAEISGKLFYGINADEDFPAVGDFVMIDRIDADGGNAVIRNILRRKSALIRKAAGTGNSVQVLAANIDIIFICMSLNEDFNLRRLERYLAVSWESGATPVIVLTKADLCDDLQQQLSRVYTVSGIADVVYCSGTAENGYAAVIPYLKEGKTVVFTGSSGVGKSTLINRLMGKEILAVNAISGGGRGRHTTTTRQMLLLPSGGIVIDTPGIRELQLAGDPASAFEDIESLAAGCKFRNCTHTAEPGCAVQEAVKSGKLPQERLNNYRKLLKETGYEGLSAKELEHKKIENMFGSMGEMKRMFKDIKNKR